MVKRNIKARKSSPTPKPSLAPKTSVSVSSNLAFPIVCIGSYVIPRNKSLSILRNVLHLLCPVESRGLRLAIELQTVNAELQIKIGDLEEVNNDVKNLLNSTEIATLFLDKELNIRRYTDSVVGIFKLRGTDIGRLFTDLDNELQYPELESHAKQVIKTLHPIETTIATTKGRWLYIRIMPYQTLDDHINGLVITFADVTELEKLKSHFNEVNVKIQKSGSQRIT